MNQIGDTSVHVSCGMRSLVRNVLLVATKVISFSVLISQARFRTSVDNLHGRDLAKAVVDVLRNSELGRIESKIISSNKKEVQFANI